MAEGTGTRDLSHWTPRPTPDGRPLAGRFVRLERLDPARHGADLGRTTAAPAALYDFLFEPPPVDVAKVEAWVAQAAESLDPFFYAVVDQASGEAVGRLALMRIDAKNGVIEVGSILFGPRLQRTAGATEAIALVAGHVFDDLGYRRLEWKCNDRNLPSKRAALRFGFSYEGLFRQHMVLKGENRDTAWFAMLDNDWPAHRRVFETWLDASNFSPDGRQRRRLEEFR
ncbi:GNAT family N-acetyltransferase [Blastochloris sulfoviridis]|uniref:GNAT family N-acetyltransferase n=1 Tax=Blastochloris sulfoviridis TaxID=50712 RepID=A0A5M6I2A7_9HYPH|nr:GNAT family protein [Blastochloris sulfoviridis]KAA5602293.1 GNAT family N-acetyltransferase [Blastochloris sulfoviridis]